MRKCQKVNHKRAMQSGKDICRTCHNIKQRSYFARGTEKWEAKRIKDAAYRAKPGVKQRIAERHRLREYGTTTAPSGLCGICNTKPATDVDHNHLTGVVRGYLCRYCNVRLSWLDDAAWTHKAMTYIAGADYARGRTDRIRSEVKDKP